MAARKKVQQEEPLQVVCKYHKTRQLYKALESKANIFSSTNFSISSTMKSNNGYKFSKCLQSNFYSL